ncbi:MAG: hypothetical protein JJ975_09225 [Bacteroidia bacterium]|nr:hypothetical protein [Bacteroidia bacterium]
MIKTHRHILASFLLLFWVSLQTADILHHLHEEVEETCQIGEEHICAPHHEAEMCELCVLVHGEQVLPGVNARFNQIIPEEIVAEVNPVHTSRLIYTSVRGRAPPVLS